jgi:threonine dehydrogenase-like Zn-dependent dehydrogenase
VINAKRDEPISAVRMLTNGGAHVAVDALGVSTTCRNAMMCLRKQGRHLQIGLTTSVEQGQIPMPIDMIVGMELEMLGSFGMPATRYPAMLAMIASGRLDPGKMVTSTCSLNGINKVFDEMAKFQNVGITVLKDYS